jgi:hypothetical protein
VPKAVSPAEEQFIEDDDGWGLFFAESKRRSKAVDVRSDGSRQAFGRYDAKDVERFWAEHKRKFDSIHRPPHHAEFSETALRFLPA